MSVSALDVNDADLAAADVFFLTHRLDESLYIVIDPRARDATLRSSGGAMGFPMKLDIAIDWTNIEELNGLRRRIERVKGFRHGLLGFGDATGQHATMQVLGRLEAG